MTSNCAKQWLNRHGEAFLRRLGVQPNQCVLDFGCRDGRYTLPAAKAVGPRGCVYALDKDPKALRQLKRKVRNRGLDNVHVSRPAASGPLPVPPQTADIAIVFDVLHGGYFPEAAERIELLRRINAALKPGGILSCYLTHLKRYGLTLRQAQNEFRRAGFRLQAKARRRLVHDDDLVRGWVFQYKKIRSRF